MKKNEIEEISEEQEEALKASAEAEVKKRDEFFKAMQAFTHRLVRHTLETNKSFETTEKQLRGLFMPKVIFANHEKRLGVDTTCANLAIKYKMIYISVYQLIKHHIQKQTPIGKRLHATRRQKELSHSSQARDEFNEVEFSAVHYDLSHVIELIKETIMQNMTTQRLVLIEGLCNTQKLADSEDQLELRAMDELMAIEKHVGDVAGIISLQFNYENENIKEEDIAYE